MKLNDLKGLRSFLVLNGLAKISTSGTKRYFLKPLDEKKDIVNYWLLDDIVEDSGLRVANCTFPKARELNATLDAILVANVTESKVMGVYSPSDYFGPKIFIDYLTNSIAWLTQSYIGKIDKAIALAPLTKDCKDNKFLLSPNDFNGLFRDYNERQYDNKLEIVPMVINSYRIITDFVTMFGIQSDAKKGDLFGINPQGSVHEFMTVLTQITSNMVDLSEYTKESAEITLGEVDSWLRKELLEKSSTEMN